MSYQQDNKTGVSYNIALDYLEDKNVTPKMTETKVNVHIFEIKANNFAIDRKLNFAPC